MMDVVSVLAGFLLGTATGAGGTYFAGVFTAQRMRQDATRAEQRAFNALAAQMPELFRAIKADLETDGQEFTREVFLLPSAGARIGGFDNRAHFDYNYNEHKALKEKFDLLAQAGFVTDITPGNAPKFKLSEPFVTHLKRWS
jgi:hypothetical protein